MPNNEGTGDRTGDWIFNMHNRTSKRYTGKELYMSDIDNVFYDYCDGEMFIVAIVDNKAGAHSKTSELYKKMGSMLDVPYMITTFETGENKVVIDNFEVNDINKYHIEYKHIPEWLPDTIGDEYSMDKQGYFEHMNDLYKIAKKHHKEVK